MVGAIIQGVANLAHHGHVEDVERRPREADSRDAFIDNEFEVLKIIHDRCKNVALRAPLIVRYIGSENP